MAEHDDPARAQRGSDGQHEHFSQSAEEESPIASRDKATAVGDAGDAAVRRMLRGSEASHGSDGHEAEADRIADEVVGGPHEEQDGEHGSDGAHHVHDGAHRAEMENGDGAQHDSAPVDLAGDGLPATTAIAAKADAPSVQRKARDGGAGAAPAAAPTVTGGGEALPSPVREQLEGRMGHDFGEVRVHTDGAAGEQATRMSAQAFTSGRDITFAPGQYRPDSAEGKHLLAHELTHVAQQGAAARKGDSAATPIAGGARGQVQLRRHHSNFFSRAGRNLRRIGRDINRGFKTYGVGFGLNSNTLGHVLGPSLANLPLEPDALNVLTQHGFNAFSTYIVEKFTSGSAGAFTAVLQMLNLLPQGPELLELIARVLSNVRPLTGEEKQAVRFSIGDNAIDWGQVRVAQNAALPRLISSLNGSRSLTFAHTIFRAPGEGTDIIVHECTHVFQYERLGLQYIPEALGAQQSHAGYGFGANQNGVNQTDAINGQPNASAQDRINNAQTRSITDGGNSGSDQGLVAAAKRGKHYRDFNREQQAMISQEFYEAYFPASPWQAVTSVDQIGDDPFKGYCYFIGELRRGQF